MTTRVWRCWQKVAFDCPPEAVDVFYDGSDLQVLGVPKIGNHAVSGAGCSLAAAVAAELSKGRTALKRLNAPKTSSRPVSTSALPLRRRMTLCGRAGCALNHARLLARVTRRTVSLVLAVGDRADLHQYDLHSVGVSDQASMSPCVLFGARAAGNAMLLKT